MLNLRKLIKPWQESGALNANINLYGFIEEDVFLTKTGDLGMVLPIAGVDYESLDSDQQQYAVRRLQAAFKAFGEGFRIYQYLLKTNRPEIPFASYGDEVIDAAIQQRREYFEAKRDRLYRIEIFYVVLMEGSRSKTGMMAALKRFPRDPDGAMRELKAQFSSSGTKVLLRKQIIADLLTLRTRVENFTRHLGEFMKIEIEGRQGQFTFFRRLLNFDDWRISGRPHATQFLDFQVVNSNIEAERDHLRVGDHYVRLLTMKEAIHETRPLVLDGLLKLQSSFYVVTEWTPIATAKARKKVNAKRRHFNMSKTGLIQSTSAEKSPERDRLVDESKQADVESLGDCLRALGDGQTMGEFSLTVVLYGTDLDAINREVGAFAGIFTNADGVLIAESYNQLNAFFATLPGNYAHNLRRLYLLNSNYADLSFLFTIHPGETTNAHLGSEYLAVLETDNATPYFLNLHNGEVAHTMVIGMTGSGKTTVLETIKEGAEKSGYAVEGFAPTSKATGQLREAGISADTLQGFLSRGGQERSAGDPNSRHIYMLDESSLASTRQMQSFLENIGPQDRVLVIGDIRQHQGVDAGRPYEQMQDAGMRTAQLDQIMRQKDPELRAAVEHLSRNDTETGIRLLQEQGRVTQVTDSKDRIQAIAKEYVARPENTIIVSPDNASRREINQAVRTELQETGAIQRDGRNFTTLVQRSDMTGADRGWAACYQAGEILQYIKGSKGQGIERGSFARVQSANTRENTVTVQRDDGQTVTYDPARLRGVSVYRETTREIATGDRIQFTAPDRKLGVANRDLGTVERVEPNRLTVKLDGKKERTVSLDPSRMPHFDLGYAVTSHSAQGLTAGRVLANVDTNAPASLINTRLAYVAVSRASEDVRIYTDDAATLGARLATDVSKTAAVDFRPPSSAEHLRQAVETLGRNETGKGVEMLQAQGRIREYADPNHRIAAIAIDYAAQPGRTVVVAPEKADRQELTHLIRAELQRSGVLGKENHSVPVLVEQQGLFPKAAGNYLPGDVIQFRAGSETHGIARDSSATVVAVEASKNQLTIRKTDGEEISYNPALLKPATMQSTVYREERRKIGPGERIVFTATDKELGVRARDFGTVDKVADNNDLTVRMDKGQTVELNSVRARHIEHGYVVDGSRAVPADRVLLCVDTSPQLTRDSPLYHALSRASQDAAIYVSERPSLQETAKGQPHIEQREAALPTDRLMEPVRNSGRLVEEHFKRIPSWEEHTRRWTPLNNALPPSEAAQFSWKAETGTIQTYHHIETHRNIHIDGPTGQFYNQDRTRITKDEALDHAMPSGHGHIRSERVGPIMDSGIPNSRPATEIGQGFGL